MDTTTKHPNSSSPVQDFRLRIARNDLKHAHELELAGAEPSEMVQLLGALRSSLMNTLAIVDQLVSDTEPAAGEDRYTNWEARR